MYYPHLEALHSLRGVTYNEASGPRVNKEKILEQYGFNKGSNPTEIVTYDYADVEAADTRSYLGQKVNDGRYSALLFRDGKWESMGACPVVYVMGQADMGEKLRLDEAGRITQIIASGAVFTPSEGTKLSIYTRKRSV